MGEFLNKYKGVVFPHYFKKTFACCGLAHYSNKS